MATAASRLLRAARNASLASRAAAAAASRAAAMASRSARAAAAAAASARAARLDSGVIASLMSGPTRGDASTKPRDDAPRQYFSSADFDPHQYFSSADYKRLPDNAKTPTDKDLESDEAIWALYERWCSAFHKKRDHAEMSRRFKIFRHYAVSVHNWNTYRPPDPEEAAIFLQKRREAKLLLSKGEDVSGFDEWYLPMELGPYADGGDPFISERLMHLLKKTDETDPFSAVEDVTAE